MSKGILFFAFNNGEIDYIKLAEIAAIRAKQFLNVPISIVTDAESKKHITSDVFDKVIIDSSEQYSKKTFRDGNQKQVKVEWKNTHRKSAFDLTPYDETLVLDVDFIVNSTVLGNCWNSPHDFLIYKDSFDLCQWKPPVNYISDNGVKFYWATVFYFKKTEKVETFFALLDYIQANWNYYTFLYNVDSKKFRNDIAFSIAIHMLSGFCDGDFAKNLPGKLYYSSDTDFLIKSKDRTFYFLVNQKESKDSYIPLKVSNLDVHVMNKYSLLRTFDE